MDQSNPPSIQGFDIMGDDSRGYEVSLRGVPAVFIDRNVHASSGIIDGEKAWFREENKRVFHLLVQDTVGL